ncbi:MAG: DUF1736 domain-containing protein [Bacteroidota bacterium]|nr:DUF1736 domain-containing protein [Bacteroidota bacterium]
MRNNKYQSKQGAKNYPRKEKVQSVQTDTRQVTGIRKKSADYYKNVQMWFIFVFAILLYSNTLFFDYTLDDQLMIYNNKFTTMGVAGFKKILSTDSFTGFFGESKQLVAGGRYRPLSHLMFAVEWQIFGKSPFEGHLFNVLLYGLACMLLFKVLTMLFNNNVKSGWYISLPFVIAALFTAHPLHTEVVANIKGRDEILSLLGSIGTMYFVLRYYETRKNTLLFYAGIVYFLGLMAKENAITYLAVIPLAIYFLKDKSLKESMICLVPMAVGAVVFIGLRTNAIGMDLNGKPVTELLNNPFIDWKAGHEYPAGMKYATIMYTLALYIKLMILPHPLTHDYYPFQIPIIGFSDYRAIISVLIYIVLIVIAVRGFLRKSIVSYGIIIFIATLSIA